MEIYIRNCLIPSIFTNINFSIINVQYTYNWVLIINKDNLNWKNVENNFLLLKYRIAIKL